MRKISILSLFLILGFSSVFGSSGTVQVPPKEKPPIIKPDITKQPTQGLMILGDNYAVDHTSVYVVNSERSSWVKMLGVDRPTFRVVAGQFARDRDTIFQMGKRMEGVDVGTFSVISGQHGYAQDDRHIYGPNGLIKEADPNTFKMLTKNYSLDAGHVFFDGKNIPEANSGSFEVIDHRLYAVDDKRVFYAGKVLDGVSPEGFVVKGPRAFARDGRVFFEGRIEKGEMPNTGKTPEVKDDNEAEDDNSSLDTVSHLFSSYKPYFVGKNMPFWVLHALGCVALLSLVFVFFADRNEEVVPFWKTLLKICIALVAGIIGFWCASWITSGIFAYGIGAFIGLLIFVALWSAMGWIKSLLVTLLSLIGIALILIFGGLIARALFPDVGSFLAFITRPDMQMLGVLKLVGIFVGTWLVVTQLHSSLFRAFGQAFVATVISIGLLHLLSLITTLNTLVSILLFVVLYSVLLWIMRFRMVGNLFAETVRIVRIGLILTVFSGVIIWIIL